MKQKPYIYADFVEEVFDDAKALFQRKRGDYGNSYGFTRDVFPNTPLITILYKVFRLVNLLSKEEQGVAPNNESIEDSYIDILNYCAMEIGYRKAEKANAEAVKGQKPFQDIPGLEDMSDSARDSLIKYIAKLKENKMFVMEEKSGLQILNEDSPKVETTQEKFNYEGRDYVQYSSKVVDPELERLSKEAEESLKSTGEYQGGPTSISYGKTELKGEYR